MDELAIAAVYVQGAGVAVREAAADAQHQIRLQEHMVADGLTHLDAAVTGVQGMILGDAALGHIGGDDREIQGLGQLHALLFRICQNDAAAHEEQGLFGLGDHADGLADLVHIRRGRVVGGGHIGVGIIVDVGVLHIQGQVDEDGAGLAGAGGDKGLSEDLRDLLRLGDLPGLLGYRRRDLGDIHALEGVQAQLRAHGLAGDGDDRDGVHIAGVDAGDEVGGAGAGGAEGHSHTAGGAEVAACRVDAALLVTVGVVADLALGHVLVKAVDAGARDAEGVGDALAFQDLYDDL